MRDSPRSGAIWCNGMEEVEFKSTPKVPIGCIVGPFERPDADGLEKRMASICAGLYRGDLIDQDSHDQRVRLPLRCGAMMRLFVARSLVACCMLPLRLQGEV